jgi:hypothetical protein
LDSTRCNGKIRRCTRRITRSSKRDFKVYANIDFCNFHDYYCNSNCRNLDEKNLS